jgi:NAD(P)-dependent dehydrogenase (short-subunit alcohol dehydrogenase family)
VSPSAIRLDVTKSEEVAAAAARAGDVTLVINNAGVGHQGGFLASDSEEAARRQLETNFFGMLRMSKAFAPVLAANDGGALLALHMSFGDTDLVRAIDSPKTSPEDIVKRALDGLESGLDEVLADERTSLVKQGLTAPRPGYLPQNA